MITKNFPEGLEVDEEISKKISQDAFVCYAGFSARKLKVIDLLKFMFRQSWLNDYYTIILVSLFAGISLQEKFFRKFESGELAHRMTGIESVKSFIDGNFVSAIFDTIFSFWSLFLMCYYSLKLTVADIFVWIIWCVVTAFIYRRVLNFQRNFKFFNSACRTIFYNSAAR